MVYEGGVLIIVGEDCFVIYYVIFYGCEIGDKCLIGINVMFMDGCKIGLNCIVVGYVIVCEGVVFFDNVVIVGVLVK